MTRRLEERTHMSLEYGYGCLSEWTGYLMTDNKSPLMSSEFDEKVEATVPFYHEFYETAIDLVIAIKRPPLAWLDTGCGTGYLCLEAGRRIPGVRFTLADPSPQMLKTAEGKLRDMAGATFIECGTEGLTCPDGTFDIITAIQCHHYLGRDAREAAVRNCFRMLAPQGLLIVFENIAPSSTAGTQIGLRRWGAYQVNHGKSEQEAEGHLRRFGTEFFPITVQEHLDLLRSAGFAVAELAWASYMQAGFFALKD